MDKSTSVVIAIDGEAMDAAFQCKAGEYCERYERDGIPLTRAEAVTVCRLVAPVCNQALGCDRDQAEREWAMSVVVRADPYTGAKFLHEENVCNFLTAFEAEHAGAAVPDDPPLKEPWDRYRALLALRLLAGEALNPYPPRGSVHSSPARSPSSTGHGP